MGKQEVSGSMQPAATAVGLSQRPECAAIQQLLGHPFPVLDSGFIRVIDFMGNDGAVVQAARVSYGAGTKQISEDRGLIRYLMRHRHTTPFEMCELKLHVRAPMDVWRQWIRHRTANVNEYSTRYSVAIDAAQRTKRTEWRRQAATNKQGSGDYLPAEEGEELSTAEADLQSLARKTYHARLSVGIAREQARKDLLLSTYTEAYWKIDLHNLLHFLELRMDPRAQLEIRSYACVIGEEIVSKWVPLIWEAFLDFRLSATILSRLDHEITKAIIAGDLSAAEEKARSAGFLSINSGGVLARNREREELERKLVSLGLPIPWRKTFGK